MGIIRRLLNSFVFWGAWILIPLLMEIVPAFGSMIILIVRRLKRKKPYEKPQIYPEISIIIPVYNSADTLYSCIKSIDDSRYPNDRIRVFLVNNGGQDDSFSVFAECQEKFPQLKMQWLNSKQGKSRALNLALYNSEGKYIINLDSDGWLEENALKNMVEKFEANPKINCMTGAILTTPDDIKKYKSFWARLLRNLEFMEYAQAFLAGRSYASELNSVYTLSGAFSAFRKSAILKSRMYNTDTICEDTQITFQMRYIYKERVEICEDAIFFVDPIENVNKLYTQRQRWQRGSLEVAKMFMDKSFKLSHMFNDINVKTLLYDHTFAFPRLIWYLALICLLCMNYSAKVILLSTAMIFALYIVVGFMYFFTVVAFLKPMPEVRKYYRNHWWCIFILPFFNLAVFFIRVAGVINSIHTDSAWRTKTLTDEREEFTAELKREVKKPLTLLRKFRNSVNYSEEELSYDDKTGSGADGKLGEKATNSVADGAGEAAATMEAVSELDFRTCADVEEYAVDKRRNNSEKGGKVSETLWFTLAGIIYFVGFLLLTAAYWVKKTYGVGFVEILNTVTGNLKGTDGNTVLTVIKGCVLPAVLLVALYIAAVILVKKFSTGMFCRRILAFGSIVVLLSGVVYANYQYDLLGYYQQRLQVTWIYEDYYVEPSDSIISHSGEKKNLIYIYVESLETTYADKGSGGYQEHNYIPGLEELANDNLSFSSTDKLGGFRVLNGNGYTSAAIFGTSTGVPYNKAVEADETLVNENYVSGVVSLGDILQKDGYNQEFLCGSDGEFGYREQFFENHGDYRVYDLFTAREEGYIPEDYNVWWGFEDEKLFDIAKDEVLRLYAEGKPFNFTMLTCDTHFPVGYVCELCGDAYSEDTANVVACTDRQVTEFVEWCMTQEFYEDTVIVIIGDHPRMDQYLVEGLSYYDRTMYNCIINSDLKPEGDTENRIFTSLDMFPTVLAAMGYEIEGDRLGLGVNMFSGEETLAEKLGYVYFDGELGKKSNFYLEAFSPELIK